MKRNDLEKIAGDYEIVWNDMIEAGLDLSKEFSIDFQFYGASKSGAYGFEKFLQELEFSTSMKVVRTAFIYKGYELKGTFKGLWTKEALYECLSLLTEVAEKYEVLFEGYGAHIIPSKR